MISYKSMYIILGIIGLIGVSFMVRASVRSIVEFVRLATIRHDYSIHSMGGMHGYGITWSDENNIVGWLDKPPVRGDLVVSKANGITSVYVIAHVTYTHNPEKMFYGAVSHLGNLESDPLSLYQAIEAANKELNIELPKWWGTEEENKYRFLLVNS